MRIRFDVSTLAAALCLAAACTNAPVPGAGGGNNTSNSPVTPIGDCSKAEPGCECSTEGRIDSCYLPPVDTGSGLECNVGSMECTGGFWSACESARSYLRPGQSALISAPAACSACDPHLPRGERRADRRGPQPRQLERRRVRPDRGRRRHHAERDDSGHGARHRW